ncbi:helix-turn-helix transcriptional regulator [Methylophilus sp. YYY-1]|uniref:helix-turn-helix domain-containing protein n=1 Tax=Methylophilus sp. YYY-1 TaxID=2682087 RepID=UPI0023B214F8|nr:helix-turn-helix transcriptional regulator [Methylophilus sp. YYY-1]MDF0377654.1 transcriptional regulator [Methylophilus sp. YYY-1]
MPKKPASSDWHPADVIAAFKKRGTSITRVARELGMCDSYLRQALVRPYPKAERVLAEQLGVTPQSIWPSRYHANGTPKSGRGERGIGRHHSYYAKKNDTGVTNKSNVKGLTGVKQAA